MPQFDPHPWTPTTLAPFPWVIPSQLLQGATDDPATASVDAPLVGEPCSPAFRAKLERLPLPIDMPLHLRDTVLDYSLRTGFYPPGLLLLDNADATSAWNEMLAGHLKRYGSSRTALQRLAFHQERIDELHEQGATAGEIAKALHCDRDNVRELLTRAA